MADVRSILSPSIALSQKTYLYKICFSPSVQVAYIVFETPYLRFRSDVEWIQYTKLYN